MPATDMSEPDPTHLFVEAIQLLIGGAIGLVVWVFTRYLRRVDALEQRMDSLVTKKEVQERCENLATLIKESQRADRAEIREILKEEVHNVLAPNLRKQPFGSLKHGFVGEIDDE